MKPLLSKEELAALLSPLGSESAGGRDVEQDRGSVQADPSDCGSENALLQIRIEITSGRKSSQTLDLKAAGSFLPIIDFDADRPLDLYLDNRLAGRGRLVQVDGKIGIRITEILPPSSAQDTEE